MELGLSAVSKQLMRKRLPWKYATSHRHTIATAGDGAVNRTIQKREFQHGSFYDTSCPDHQYVKLHSICCSCYVITNADSHRVLLIHVIQFMQAYIHDKPLTFLFGMRCIK